MIVFGLPGVGKSTLIKKATKDNNFVRLSGGTLISENISDEDRDTLRKKSKDQILSNQEILIFNFLKTIRTLSDRHIIFDGHCIVKENNSITPIPLNIIKRLQPNILVFIDEPSEVIIERRKHDLIRPDREIETIADIDVNRKMQLEICKSYSVALKIPLKVLVSPEQRQMNSIINKLIGI